MDALRTPDASVSPFSRSALSNGSRLHDKVDGRSAPARRFRDIFRSLATELGGEANLTEPKRALLRQAAGVMLESERMQAAIVRGETVDPEHVVRLSNTLARLMGTIGVKGNGQPPKGKSLETYLAGRGS